MRLSRDRIDRLGFFEKVEVDTPAVPGTTDQIDVNFVIKERPTGTIQAGAGYSQVDKLVLQGSYSQQNVFGTGNALSFEINTSRSTRVFSVTHVNPYVTQDGISRSIEVSDRTTNFQPLGQGNLTSTARVAGVGFGVPFTEFDTVFFGVRYELTRLAIVRCATIAPNTPPEVLPPPSDPQFPPLPIPVTVVPYCLSSPQRYITYVDQFGDEPKALIGTIGWSRDSRDNLLVPTRGRYQRISGEIGTPAYDLQYLAARYQYQQFEPLTPKFTLAFNGELAWGKGYGGRPYPLFKNFFAGGLGTGGVRGYESGSLGPREIVNGQTGSALGGTRRINGSIEALAPLPGADRTLRALTFIDGGQVWGETESIKLKELRYSTGIGIAWVSPIGPLKLSWALPLHSQPGDQVQRFQFQIGTGF